MIEFNNVVHGVRLSADRGRPFTPGYDTVISRVTPEGNLMGGVVYDTYTGNCVFMHITAYSKFWLLGNMLWIAFDYPFNKLKVGKVVAMVNSHRQEMLDLTKRFGFKEEARIKDAYPDGDVVITSMTRAECRWLNIKPKVYAEDSPT